jgi:UDP-N-acetylmuramoyl-L-alanyl-D-glutamate--2,6-diaminopimelate ligase
VIHLEEEYEQKISRILNARGIQSLYIRNSDLLSFKKLEENLEFTRGYLQIYDKSYLVRLPFFSDIMVGNLLVAIGIVLQLGYQLTEVERLCANLKLPMGRLEKVAFVNGAPVIIDYGHTPDAFKAVLSSLRPLVEGKIHLVFGCGGETDHVKRSGMALNASSLSDIVYITDDNPRYDDPAEIRKMLLDHCTKGMEIPDRSEAITTAMRNLKPKDCLIIAGKGHETCQEIRGERLPHSDHAVVRDFMAIA